MIQLKLSIICMVMFFSCYSEATAPLESDTQMRILLIDPWYNPFVCGMITNYAQAKAFNNHNVFFLTLLWEKSFMEELYIKENLSYEIMPFAEKDDAFEQVLKRRLYQICKKHRINYIITLKWQDLPVIKETVNDLDIKIIFHRVASLEQDKLINNLDLLSKFDGIVTSPILYKKINELTLQHNLNIKKMDAIAPFWDESRAQNTSNLSRQEYYKNMFNITINDEPVICTIANFVNPCKNHGILLQAARTIIHEYNIPLHVMLAGSGYLKDKFKKMAEELNIKEHVHFLDTVDDVAALFANSDINVLPSYYENFSIACLEAASLNKPSILSDSVDAAIYIKNNETGLLFKNMDYQDLAIKIFTLIDNPQQAKLLGINAHEHARLNYSSDVLFKRWYTFLGEC